MKVVILTGSPRKHGNSAYLADEFQRGAEEAGNEVFRFDTAFQKFEGCLGCNHCGMNGDCVQKDDFTLLLRKQLIEADAVIFASPVYYYGFSAQLKKAIDRFYAINGKIQRQSKKAVLLATFANPDIKVSRYMAEHYEGLVEFLGWENIGEVIAKGVWGMNDVRDTEYPTQAYLLGKKLK